MSVSGHPFDELKVRLDYDECLRALTASFPAWDTAIDESIMTFDGAAAVSCLRSWCDATCDEQLAFDKELIFEDPCEVFSPVQGTLGFGQECYEQRECVHGGCSVGGNACPGTCTAPCPPCTDAQYCDANINTCVARFGENIPCDPAVAGMCAEGFACIGTVDATGVTTYACGATGQTGYPCATNQQCISDHYCNLAAAPAQCTPRLADGETCTADRQCTVGSTCADWAVSPICALVGQINSPCMSPQDCAVGLRCATENLPAICLGSLEGDPCTRDRECAEGMVCSTSITGLDAGTCVQSKLLPPGSECLEGFDRCEWPTLCLGSDLEPATCRLPGEHGTPCASARECVGHSCQNGTCVLPLPTGSPCTTHGECQGYCSSGMCADLFPDGQTCAIDPTCTVPPCTVSEACESKNCEFSDATQNYVCAPVQVCGRP